MLNTQTIILDEKCKDKDPSSTITYLKNILDEMGIEVDEEWQKESSIGTWALRVTFKNTAIGANGKGTSKLYAIASAYAELFERFQNDLFMSFLVKNKNAGDFLSSYDEKIMSSKDIVKENNAYVNFYFNLRNMQNDSINNKAKAFNSIQKADYMLYEKEDAYVTVPFYSVREDKVTYLPQHVYRLSYGSNGMSAGNTIEEAFVQGVAEIIERYVQKRILLEQTALPTIPDEYIKKFPQIYEFYSAANKVSGYTCILKDCSFGGQYPVAALIVLEKNTGRYGIKLGCHPNYGIAMERTFTEAAQGQDIISYSDRSIFDFYNKRVCDNMNIYNTYKVGKGQFPYQLFGSNPDYPFTEVPSAEGLSNKEMAKRWCNNILADGYDVLIRNVSSLGFPSLHVIIPGMSEMFEADDVRYKVYNTRNFVISLLTEPRNITKDNCKYIITIMEYFSGSILENSISSYYPWYRGLLPCASTGLGCIYMTVMCHYLEGNYKAAADKMKNIITLIDNKVSNNFKLPAEEYYWYTAIYYLCSAMDTLKSFEIACEYLSLLFDEDIVTRIKNLFYQSDEIIIKQYPDYETYAKSGANPYIDEYAKIRYKLQAVQMKKPINQLMNREIF